MLKARISLIQNTDRRYQPKVSIVRGDKRLIVRRTSGTAELFDIARDPDERHDLSADRPDLVDEMMQQMATWHRAEASRFYCAVRALPVPKPPPLPVRTVPPAGNVPAQTAPPGKPAAPQKAAKGSPQVVPLDLRLRPGSLLKPLKSRGN